MPCMRRYRDQFAIEYLASKQRFQYVKREAERDMRFKTIQMGLLASFLLFLFFTNACSNGKAKQSAPSAPVKTGDVTRMDVPLQINAIGNVEAYNTVSVKAMI